MTEFEKVPLEGGGKFKKTYRPLGDFILENKSLKL